MFELVIVGLLVLLIGLVGFLVAYLIRMAGQDDSGALNVEIATLRTQLEAERDKAAEKMHILEASEQRLKTEFENLANRIFEEKGRRINEEGRERMEHVIKPFKEQLESFRRRVDEVHKDGTEQSARLLSQVRHLHELSNRVSDEANHLAQAIKGDSKTQGDWGELVIERIFEASGLTKGREYDAQAVFRDDEDHLKRPDFILYLPDHKALIIDSKVSLTAYERFVNAEDEEARNQALAGHLLSVRKHIKELQEKKYTDLLGNRSLDFVLMCIPLEPAYQCALQHDPGLLEDLARTRVVMTGPTTLMITLKLIAQIWRREHENRNAEQIADKAGRLYDQVKLIVDAVTDARKKMKGVDQAFQLAEQRLSTGRGNLVGRVVELRKLGAKINKPLPPDVVQNALEATSDEDGK